MTCLEVVLILSILLYFLYKWSTKTFGTFEERGIPYRKPLPLIGNAWPFLKNQESLHKIMIDLYRETKQHKVYGFYNFRAAFFIVNDPQLIKKMGVKDFEAFANHQPMMNMEKDPLLGAMLNVMRGQRWKNMRNTVAPIFTGSKMRAMFTLMNDCFAESMKYLQAQQAIAGYDASFDVELKECFSRLSNDLIASTAFGLKINSFENKDNEFYSIGRQFTQARGKQAAKFILFSIAPKLFEWLGLKMFDQDKTDYFVRLVVEAMKYRQQHKIVRPDMIELLMKAKRESSHQWSDEDIVAQCLIFFFAAFENNANLLCTTCYELVDHLDVQEKLYDEIIDTQRELAGRTLDYDSLKKMKYMDMVVSESLRKWSLAAMIDRECGKDYTVTDDDGKFVCELKKGDRVWFHTIGLHWDEEYYKNPRLFDPERFNEENKHDITPSTYTPFGVGPRICIGSRYALMQAKAMLYYLLKEFRLKRSEKACKDLLADIRGFQMAPKSGFWFKLEKRPQTTELAATSTAPAPPLT